MTYGGAALQVPIGTTFTVNTSEPDMFLTWSAPGTLIDGSGEPGETFTVTGNVTITESVKTPVTVFIYEGFQVVGTMNGRTWEELALSDGTSWQGNWFPGYSAGSHANRVSGGSVWVNNAGTLGRTTAPQGFTFGSMTHTDATGGGGRAAMGHATIYVVETLDSGPMFLNSVTVAKPHPLNGYSWSQSLAVEAIPDKGFFNASVPEGLLPFYWGPIAVEGEFKPLGQLKLNVEAADGDEAPCAGYCTASPARKYYTGGPTPYTKLNEKHFGTMSFSGPVAGRETSARAITEEKIEYTLTLKPDGDDVPCSGYVTADPARRYYAPGTVVTLEAVASPGYRFKQWKGDGVLPTVQPQQPIPIAGWRSPVVNIAVLGNWSIAAEFALDKPYVVVLGGEDFDPGDGAGV